MDNYRRHCLALSLTLPALLAVDARADVILDWNGYLLDAVRQARTSPPVASRAMAMVDTAIFDAVNAASGLRFRSYDYSGPAVSNASADAAGVAAAYTVLKNLFPAASPQFDAGYASSLAAISDSAAKTRGISLGTGIGAARLAARSNDGASVVAPYTPGTGPGQWRPTPPAFAPALLPAWGDVKPWGVTISAQFLPASPPDLNSAAYASDYNEVKSLGRVDSSTRTAEQTEIARFWADGAGTETPPGHWLSIATEISAQRNLSLADNARLFALLGTSLADAAITAWDAKYDYNLWRPITAIVEADTDGNAATIADPTWTPLLTTPPFPECVSGHSTFSGAAANILGLFFGSDDVAFTIDSDGLSGVERAFAGFSAAALEAGRSRIYGGIHFEFSDRDGLASGRALSAYIYENYFQLVAVPTPASILLLFPGVIALWASCGRKQPRVATGRCRNEES